MCKHQTPAESFPHPQTACMEMPAKWRHPKCILTLNTHSEYGHSSHELDAKGNLVWETNLLLACVAGLPVSGGWISPAHFLEEEGRKRILGLGCRHNTDLESLVKTHERTAM